MVWLSLNIISAVLKNLTSIVQILVDSGVDTTVENNENQTPLEMGKTI